MSVRFKYSLVFALIFLCVASFFGYLVYRMSEWREYYDGTHDMIRALMDKAPADTTLDNWQQAVFLVDCGVGNSCTPTMPVAELRDAHDDVRDLIQQGPIDRDLLLNIWKRLSQCRGYGENVDCLTPRTFYLLEILDGSPSIQGDNSPRISIDGEQ